MKSLIRKLNTAMMQANGMNPEILRDCSLGDTVVIHDLRFLSFNPDTTSLPVVVGFANCEPRVDGIFGVYPNVTHVVVEFLNSEGGSVQVAAPVSSLRTPTFVEGLLNRYNEKSFSLRPLGFAARAVKKTLNSLYGIPDTNFYIKENESSEEVEVVPELPATPEPIVELEIVHNNPEPKVLNSKPLAPLLDWDTDESGFEDNKEEKVSVPAPVVETPKALEPVAPPSVEPAVQVIPTPEPYKAFVELSKEELLLKAQKNIGMLNREDGLEELEGATGRVEVDAKQMILCRADLNQLVPFKYDWAWQAYLKATEHHWMHTEINLEKDIVDWKNCTPDESKLISFALYSLEINGLFKTDDSLLALYRSITNPEARQYILRQRFELTVWGNFVHHVIDNFQFSDFPAEEVTNERTGKTVRNCDWYTFTDANYMSYFKREQIGHKQRLRHSLEAYVGDPTFTPTVETRLDIVRRIVARYISFGFTYNFASILQLSMLERKNKFHGLAQGANLMLRDLALHTSFGLLVLQYTLNENADLLQDPKTAESIIEMIRHDADVEIEYMDWWANSDLPNAKSVDQIQTLKFMLNRMTNSLGFGDVYEGISKVAPIPEFVEKYDNFIPSLHGGGSSVTGGALTF